ncbi:MAG: UPF0175 family protein [Bacteroidales bacterium]|nr:UPF0175 family protein [Bacteroidales bacterium]MCF8458595.1 UPF0175 family protein [Bacteroidales bacterium]
MKNTTIHIPVTTELLLSLNQSPQEFGIDMKKWAAISMYYFGKISLARAASLAGLHRFDFEKLLSEYKIPISLLDETDAEKEINLLNSI